MKAMLRALFGAVALSLLGCVGFYVPPLSNKPYSGKPLAGRDADFITAGKTTRAEVVTRLGTGYRDSVRVRAIAYPWELPGSYWFFAIAPGPDGDEWKSDPENTRWRALFVDFDSRGIVTRKEFVRLKKKLTLDEQLESWAGWVPSNSPPVLLP